MQRMWRKLFAAVLGVVALTGAAAAQSPPPQPLPPIVPIAAPVAVQHAPVAVVPQLMPAGGRLQAAAQPAPAPAAPAAPAAAAPAAPAYAQNAPLCNSGCGSLKSDCKFMFGSCKSFFSPCTSTFDCNDSGLGRFRGKCGGGLCDKCPNLPWGTPYGTGHSGCKYDSWLNH